MLVVLFACVQNAGRSQMAAAWFNLLTDPSKARAASAGTRPANHIHPSVVAAMNEVGVDLARARPQLLTPDLASSAHWLITMGCGDECPVLPRVKRDDWPLDDPADLSLPQVRSIRDQIRRRVEEFVARENLP